MVFLKHATVDKLNQNSVKAIKNLFARKKLIKRIGFETILGTIKQRKPDDADVF